MNFEDLSWAEFLVIVLAATIVFLVGTGITKPVSKSVAPTCIVKPKVML